MEFLDHVVSIFFTFLRASMLFPTVVAPVYIPTKQCWMEAALLLSPILQMRKLRLRFIPVLCPSLQSKEVAEQDVDSDLTAASLPG